ncbi:MAG: sigma-54 dependent transcriptional regulator [Planctomycetota bacterium]
MCTADLQALRVLIVDDLPEARRTLSRLLETEGLEPQEAEDGATALEMMRARPPDVMLVDMKMPGMDGTQLLDQARKLNEDVPIIVVTAFGSIASAVETVRNGAYDYITKPFDNNKLVLTIRRALETHRLRKENRRLLCSVVGETSLPAIMGSSHCVEQLFADVQRVAPTDFTVVITGETGAGKEVVARAIHGHSRRAASPFIPVDCGSIAPSLMESELFGHEKGAFTGAVARQTGRFEQASGGTLFLDEISNLPLSLQAKLLRALQEKQICPVGGRKGIKVDIRVVTATNRDLAAMVASGDFRRDLYHRLNEFAIHVPPLRERREDIGFLANRFLALTNKELNKNVQVISNAALEVLMAHAWLGNVRELRNVIRRAVLLASTHVDSEHLDLGDLRGDSKLNGKVAGRATDRTAPLKEIVRRRVRQLERDVLIQALRETGGNKARAARMLQIDYKTMHTKIREYEIST